MNKDKWYDLLMEKPDEYLTDEEREFLHAYDLEVESMDTSQEV